MRLWILICIIVTAAWLVGTAHAQVIEGTGGPDVLNGTSNSDRIFGYGGGDTINAKGNGDYAKGGSGADTLDMGCGHDNPVGNDGEDLIYVDCADDKGDVVDCGPDDDIVFWRVAGTVIFDNCENVYHVTSTGDRASAVQERP